MRASEIIINSVICKQAAANIYPEEPNELFNACWLKLRERELRDADWKPDNDAKRYFLRMMKHQAIDWRKARQHASIDQVENELIDEVNYQITPQEIYLVTWLNDPTEDEDLQFLKNILTLALYCQNTKNAYELAGISKSAFWRYKKLAEKRFYDDFKTRNPCDVSSLHLV